MTLIFSFGDRVRTVNAGAIALMIDFKLDGKKGIFFCDSHAASSAQRLVQVNCGRPGFIKTSRFESPDLKRH
jgi:hypothetical protein